MGNFLTLKFWFAVRPDSLTVSSQRVLLIFIGLLLLATIVIGIWNSRNKNGYTKLFNNLYYFCLTNAIVGAFLLFFNYEMVPFLSSRFWYLFWAIGIIVWLYFIIKLLLKIPKRKAELEKEKEFKRYIP